MRSLVSALVSIAMITPAYAQSDADKANAKMHYQNAETAMAEGRYEGAAAEYIEAYEVMKDPILFYKIGTAYQKAGKCPEAVVFYKRYVREGKPTEEFGRQVEERIAECEGGEPGTGTGSTTTTTTTTSTTTTPEPTTEPEAPEPEPEPEPEPDPVTDPTTDPSFLDEKPSPMRSAGWVLMGATVAFATAGTILAMSGQSREEDLESLADFRDPQGLPAAYDGNVQERYDDLVDEGDRFNTYATVAFIAAGAAAVTSITLLVLDSRKSSESGSAITTIVPVIGRDSAGVAAALRF